MQRQVILSLIPWFSEVADYLLWLWELRKFSVFSVKAHRSMLSAVFRFKLLELWCHHVLRDLIRSFGIKRPFSSSIAFFFGLGFRTAPSDVCGLRDFGKPQFTDLDHEFVVCRRSFGCFVAKLQ